MTIKRFICTLFLYACVLSLCLKVIYVKELLLNYCFMYLPLFVGVLCLSLFWYALLCVLSSFAICPNFESLWLGLRILDNCMFVLYLKSDIQCTYCILIPGP